MNKEEELNKTVNLSGVVGFETNLNTSTQFDGFERLDIQIEKEEVYVKQNSLKNSIKTKRLGNLFAFLFNKEGEPQILIGPHWPFFACLASTISLMSFLFFYFLGSNLNHLVKVIGILIYVAQIMSYTFIFLKNPGIPLSLMRENTNTENLEFGYKFCDRCMITIAVNENSNHCEDCNVCVLDYDHHCPWTSKCIGKGNIFSFYVFITLTMILFGYFIFAVSMIEI